MEQITASINLHKHSALILALHRIYGLTGASFTHLRSFGRGRGSNDPDATAQQVSGFLPCVQIEIVCLDTLIDEILSMIEKTGLRLWGATGRSTCRRTERRSRPPPADAARQQLIGVRKRKSASCEPSTANADESEHRSV